MGCPEARPLYTYNLHLYNQTLDNNFTQLHGQAQQDRIVINSTNQINTQPTNQSSRQNDSQMNTQIPNLST